MSILLTLSELTLFQAPYRPIHTSLLAIHHYLEDSTVSVSPHLPVCDTSELTDELSTKMGTRYVKQFLDLRHTRHDAIPKISMEPPAMHQPTNASSSRT